MEIDPNEIFALLGMKKAELVVLRRELAIRDTRLKELEKWHEEYQRTLPSPG